MKMFSRNRSGGKRIDKKRRFLPLFHGSKSPIRPEDFDFNRSDAANDFNRAIYLSPKFDSVSKWSESQGFNNVSWYVFNQEEANQDPDTDVRYFDDQIEWLDTIIEYYEGTHTRNEDIIIGDTMDGKTSAVIRKYERLAKELGISMKDLEIAYKQDMIEELKVGKLDQQVAIKTQKGLCHLIYIDSGEANRMYHYRYMDPSEIAAQVSEMISVRDSIPVNDAMILFMRSRTFHRLISEPDMSELSPGEVLAIYDEKG